MGAYSAPATDHLAPLISISPRMPLSRLRRFRALFLLGLALGSLCLFLIIFWLSFSCGPADHPNPVVMAKSRPQVGAVQADQSKAMAAAFGPLWPKMARLDCGALINGTNPELLAKLRKNRIVLPDDPVRLDMSCPAIRARWQFRNGSVSAQEAQFPMAFARTVYKDYLLLEQMLSVEYAPQNVYCYALDAKAPDVFKRRVRALAACFSNVRVARVQYRVHSNGKNVTRAQLACMRELVAMDDKWKYAVLLQNHDLPLRTNGEFAQILRVYNGTNDVATRPVVPISINRSLDWSIGSLRLYRKGHPEGLNASVSLRHTKSLNLVALSRAAVEFTLNSLNLEPMIERLERSEYGMDEVLFSTLNSNLPDFPGGFTHRCLDQSRSRPVPNMGRYTIWHGPTGAAKGAGGCRSGRFRHAVCVYGVEDLRHIGRERLHFYLNKMLPSFDFGASFCWLNELAVRRQRQTGQNPSINRSFYAQLAHINAIIFSGAPANDLNNDLWDYANSHLDISSPLIRG